MLRICIDIGRRHGLKSGKDLLFGHRCGRDAITTPVLAFGKEDGVAMCMQLEAA